MSKIEKLPSGNYRIRVYNKYTGQRKSFTASTIKEAKALAAQYSLSVSEDDLDDCTIGDAVSNYIENRSSILSPSTQTSYKKIQSNNISGIDSIMVNQITSEDLQKWVNALAVDHKPKTVRNIYGLVISSIHAVNPNKHINVTLPKKKPIERHIPTDKDIQNLLKYADSRYLRLSIMLASIGTLRRGEICALKYEDIDGNTIHVHADIVQTPEGEWVYKDMPKTASSDRYIEFPKEVIKEIGTGKGFIIHVIPNTITKSFIRLRNSLNLQCKFHDLRAYAASIMHAIGVPDQYIQERGGWQSPAVLRDIYRNALDDKSKEFSKKTNDYLRKML